MLSADNGTVRLGPDDEPQPDVLLMILPDRGGQATISSESYVEGPQELVAEVASSSVSYGLGVKLEVYRQFGVREYVVWRVLDEEIDWFVLRGDLYDRHVPGADGILRSEVFPGLWLDPAALIKDDGPRVLSVLQQGIASPEHTAFVQRLYKAAE